jgi:rhodanese-related sulfurtransferase
VTAEHPLAEFASVEDFLAAARSRLQRLDVAGLAPALAQGAGIVDIRPAWARAAEGEIVGSLIVERNHLEWRLHPRSDARLALADTTPRWVVVCSEGYTSSLAAAALRSLGIDATDLIGGMRALRPPDAVVQPSLTPADSVVVAGRHLLQPVSGHLGYLGGPDVEGEAAH